MVGGVPMKALALLLVLVGCGRPVPYADGPPDSVFPHDAAFLAAHGTAWKETGACTGCHAVYGEAEAAGPACTACHPAYPHTPAVALGAVHGPAWQGKPSDCTSCHGEDGDRVPAGAAAGACVSCHTTYPHTTTWRAPAGHGAAVLAHGGAAACESCHGADLAFCASCHPSYPHPEGWSQPEAHGHAWLAGGAADTCGSGCHTAPVEGGTPACAQCHASYPHPADWTPTGHIPTVQTLTQGACAGCHTPGSLRGPAIPNNCASACHGEGL